jgi:hypothetical protein
VFLSRQIFGLDDGVARVGEFLGELAFAVMLRDLECAQNAFQRFAGQRVPSGREIVLEPHLFVLRRTL